MSGSFFKNMSYMSLGTFFQLFIALLSTAVYIRIIGTSGYAILGIVFSFMNLIWKFDIPFYLSFVKYKSNSGGGKAVDCLMYNTLYNSLLLSNIAVFAFLMPVAVILSNTFYKDTSLIPFYFVAIAILMLLRANFFLRSFLRANKIELEVQKATIINSATEFTISLSLMLIFNFGVLSIFIGGLLAVFVEYLMLTSYAKAFVVYKPNFSLSFLIKSLRECSFPHYISRVLNSSVLNGALFISTFYLDTKSLGVLSIIISIATRLQDLYIQSFWHLSPIYQNQFLNGYLSKAKEIMSKITVLLLAIFALPIVILLLFGEKVYLYYFGNALQGTYLIFLLIVLGSLLYLSFVAVENYLFISNIRYYNKIKFFLVLFFFFILLPLAAIFGINGIAMSIFVVGLIRAVLFLHLISKDILAWNKKEMHIFLFAALSCIAGLLLYELGSALFVQISLVLILAGITTYIFKIKSIFKTAKYVIFEV